MVQKEAQLIEELEPFRTIMESTMEPVIHIRTIKRQTTIFESKFGGEPYYPLTAEYPTNEKGEPLHLLAQLNFEHLPSLPYFPSYGILQFFIDGYDDLLGMNLQQLNDQKRFRVIFHKKIIEDDTQLMQDFSFLSKQNEKDFYFPVEKEMALTFTSGEEPLSLSDYRSESVYKNLLQHITEKTELESKLLERYDGSGHKIGGYPFFTQTDSRQDEEREATVLLLQIDSIDKHITWGDCGVGNFFITEEDLKNRDFSRVLYHWDCY